MASGNETTSEKILDEAAVSAALADDASGALDATQGEAARDTHHPVAQHFNLNNRAHAQAMELVLFEDGWLSIRQHLKIEHGRAGLIDLQYLDPEPEITRTDSPQVRQALFGCLGGALITALLAALSILENFMMPLSALLWLCSLVLFCVHSYLAQERVVFFTRYGRAPVVALFATLGTFREMRRLVPALKKAIGEAQPDTDTPREQIMQSEMREHHRLQENKIISQLMYQQSLQRILEQL